MSSLRENILNLELAVDFGEHLPCHMRTTAYVGLDCELPHSGLRLGNVLV